MNDVEISLELSPDQADLDLLIAGLGNHSTEFTPTPGFEPIAVFARESSGDLAGGASGFLNWSWLNVSLLWVSPTHRGEGLGALLLSKIESAAIERGCTSCHLSTFGFQALDFYKTHGYEVFAELPNYLGEHSKIFLKKRLTNE